MRIFERFIESAGKIERQKLWRQWNGSFWLKGVKYNTPNQITHVVLIYLIIISLSMPVLPFYKKITIPLSPSPGKVLAAFIHSFTEWSRQVWRICKTLYRGTMLSPRGGSTNGVIPYGSSTEGRCILSTNDWRGGESRGARGLRIGEATYLVYWVCHMGLWAEK